ncbi:hypothetical protein ES702_03070 [subsurface metagenome]
MNVCTMDDGLYKLLRNGFDVLTWVGLVHSLDAQICQ